MARNPQVSVIIPTRDRWTLLGRSLRCALSQEDVDLEVVVVDDGSRDGPPREMPELRDPRVRLLRHETSQGVARARNRAIAHAAGDWLAFLDDDDLWAPGKLAAQVAAGEAAGAGFVYTGTVWLNGEGVAGAIYEASPAETVAKSLRQANVVGGPSAIMAATEAVRVAGAFDTSFSVMADWDLWLRLAEREGAAACTPPLTGYVVHEGSMHRNDMDRVWREFRILKAKHRLPGEKMGGHDFRVWMAGTYRGQGDRIGAARAHASIGWHDRRPKELARAVGLLFGERAMRAVAGPRPPKPPGPPTPEWVGPAMAQPVAA